jgi:hypothetical protein
MAGIIAYPVTTPESSDLLLGTEIKEDGNLTKNFTIGSIFSLIKQEGFLGLPIYANNAAAILGGLTEGNVYRTSFGVLMVVFNP